MRIKSRIGLFTWIIVIVLLILATVFVINYLDILNPGIDGAKKAYLREDYGKAAKIYEKLSERDSGEVDAQLGLAGCYEKLGEFGKAQEAYTRAVALSGKKSQKKKIIQQIVRFFSRNSLYQEYTKFINEINQTYGEKWVRKNIVLWNK